MQDMTKRKIATQKASEKSLRNELVEAGRQLAAAGLSPGRSGNLSVRFRQGMLITPSGLAVEALSPEDMVFVPWEGEVPPGQKKPSSEWRFHRDIYLSHPHVAAVVHCHSPMATALACARKPIPAFHYMVAVAGGDDIPLAPYARFGTQALSDAVVAALKRRKACLMANHGQLATGPTLAAALALAQEVETLAKQYVVTLAIGGAVCLSKAEMAEALAAFSHYGQNDES